MSQTSVVEPRVYRIPPYQHQVEGIMRLVEESYFALFDEMGAGKTLQVIGAAQILYHMNLIDRVLVICPASVRGVWFDPELGELAKHLWAHTPSRIAEFHQKIRIWYWGPPETQKIRRLKWTITNYDFVRVGAPERKGTVVEMNGKPNRFETIRSICGPRTLLVLDESSAVKNWSAKQTKACYYLRQQCGRVILLNGTPIANHPGDMYSQGYIMSPRILNCKSWFEFRARYAIMGGWQGKVITGWMNIEDIQRRFAPYVLRRLKSQCLDLPEKIPPVTIEVTLTKKTWDAYKAMRDEMVAWLTESTVSIASQAAVKAIRLAQITSGFLGGVDEEIESMEAVQENRPAWLGPAPTIERKALEEAQEVGREKLDAFLTWYFERLAECHDLKIVVWCRFRLELDRLYRELLARDPLHAIALGRIWGGQRTEERQAALRLLDPRTAPAGPVVVIGTPSSGSMGLNLTAAWMAVHLSNDFNLKTRLQSDDRIHRPGQHRPCSYFDVVARGPDGQKTIDAHIIKKLRHKEDIATMTTGAWVAMLTDE